MNWGPKEMDKKRQMAYRNLLYVALLEIRVCGLPPRGMARLNPLAWLEMLKSQRYARSLAEWLHNLADFSSADFAYFNEALFWDEYTDLTKKYTGHMERYKSIFEEVLSEGETSLSRWAKQHLDSRNKIF